MNRRTEENVWRAGLRVTAVRREPIWREIEAQPGYRPQSRPAAAAGPFSTGAAQRCLDDPDMNRWIWAAVLVVEAHFGASYVAPTGKGLGFFNFVWPWATGDSGLFGTSPVLVGIWLGGGAALLFVLAVLSLFGIWIPHDWWRGLAIAGAVVSLVLMVGFFGPTKLIPIALDLAVIAALATNWAPARLPG